MGAEYVVFKRGARVPERSVDREAMLERVDLALSKGDKAKVWPRHRPVPKFFRARKTARDRVEALTRDADPGARVLLLVKGQPDVLVIQKVERSPRVIDLGCNPQIEKAHALLWGRFGEEKLRSAGRYYCRYIDQPGPKVVSRHGYVSKEWKGSAEDIFGEGGMNTMAGLAEIAKFLVRQHEAGNVKLYTVIYGDRKWRAGEGWGAYGGVFHTHVHYDALGGQACRP